MTLFNGDFEIIQWAPGWPSRKDACLSIPSAGMKVHKVSVCSASPRPQAALLIVLSASWTLRSLPSFLLYWTSGSSLHARWLMLMDIMLFEVMLPVTVTCKFCIFTLYINNHIALYSIQMVFMCYSCLISFRAQWWEKCLFDSFFSSNFSWFLLAQMLFYFKYRY